MYKYNNKLINLVMYSMSIYLNLYNIILSQKYNFIRKLKFSKDIKFMIFLMHSN